MIVIIGTGLAGYMAAKEFRKLNTGTKLTLITKSKGDFYSKPLLSTSLTNKKEPSQLVISTAEQMAQQLQADIITNTVVESIDRKAKTIRFNKKNLHYDKLILATGAETLDAPLQGDSITKMFSINNLEDYVRFRMWLTSQKKHIAIIGSGLVGCEFANDLVNTGYQIDIISLDSYPLAKFIPEKIGRALQAAFAEKGVRWHLNMPVIAINKRNDKFILHLENNTKVIADGVISAVGLQADKRLAKQAGLKVNLGIEVNRLLQTSDPNIYALGDCAEVEKQLKQYVAPLLQCARYLAKILTGANEKVIYPVMPIVIKTPACPLATMPPPVAVEGEWHYEGEGQHQKALFYDQKQQLRGFTLIGDKVRDKIELVKQLPSVF